MLRAINVVGARPNFMKLAPVHRAMVDSGRVKPIFVHTGQHYDVNMSQAFLDRFDLPPPDFELEVGSGSHAQQTAAVMERLEPVIEKVLPDVVVVFGDVNSTIAAALAAVKLGVPVAHVEAGLRSYDRTMPEEINRLLTDAISDYLFAPSRGAVDNLRREGISDQKIFFVGNVMIDTLLAFKAAAEASTIANDLGLDAGGYILVTLHRPSNVDDLVSLTQSVDTLKLAADISPVIFPAHPRTRIRLEETDLLEQLERAGVRLVEPVGYVEFLALTMGASAVLTDSGGIQEETTVLGVPCVTMRTTTERPITVTEGTNRVVGTDPRAVADALRSAVAAPRNPGQPELWDGRTSERIVEVLTEKR